MNSLPSQRLTGKASDTLLTYEKARQHLSRLRSELILQRTKKILDLGIATLFFPVAIPLMGLIALCIRLDSSGPIFYRQTRVGERERRFQLIKFRTMVKNAEEETGAIWAGKNDSRVTRVGRILRMTRLDELPQLFNVLSQEMSFIGPRPERPEFVRDLEAKIPYYSLRHSVKPGITGWAQVNYPYGASVEDAIEKLQYDLFYIQNMSLLLDLRIFLKTIHVVLFGKGSR
jgi:exopolysaccharide biosynthesis polyprenyl glycosylphosphotransferase